jgi:hypothetical protein
MHGHGSLLKIAYQELIWEFPICEPNGMARVMRAGIFFPSKGSLRPSPARQRRFSLLQKGKNPFCKGIPLT